MTEWYNLSWSDVVDQLQSDAYNGLTEDKVEKFKKLYGKNTISIPKGKNILYTFISQFKNLWILYMFIIIAIHVYLGYINEGITLFGIIMLNIILISFRENEREKEIIELQKLQSSHATVIRSGKRMKISSEDLVVGDIVLINDGDIVPADIRIIEGNDLIVKEGAVTGEGDSVEKYSTKIEEKELALTEIRNVLFKSSAVIQGDGRGIVIATGQHTEIAGIIGLILDSTIEINMINRKLHNILNIFTTVSIIISAFLAMMKLYVLEHNIENILYIFGWIPATFIPFSLFILIEIIAYFIIKDFKGKGVVFKNLSVIENLSKTNIVCEDKVGVFSQNVYYIDKIYADEDILDMQTLNINEERVKNHTLKRVIDIGLMCNEEALLKLYKESPGERVFIIPFDKGRKLMTTVNKIDGNYRAGVKGASDSLLNSCTHLMKNGLEKEITEEDIRKIKYADVQMSTMGLNVVAYGYRNYSYEPSINENLESNLVFAGLIGFYNPPIENIGDIIKRGKSLNVYPIIFTEENKLTAETFGKEIGLINRVTRVLSAVEMDNMPEEDLLKTLGKVPIFSRLQSSHKTTIGKYYKKLAQNTVMSGKRVSDLPYLRVSKVGVSVEGRNIVNNLSDIVMSKRSYEDILNLIISSRKIINSIVSIIIYILIISLAGVMLNIAYNILGFGYVLTTYGALWVNSITAIISSIAIALNYENEDEYKITSIDKKLFKGTALKSIVKAMILSGIVIGSLFLNEKIPFLILNLSLILLALGINKKHTLKSKLCFLINIIIQVSYFIINIRPNI